MPRLPWIFALPLLVAAAAPHAGARSSGGSAGGPDEVEDLIARGRAELEAGRTSEAQHLFDEAADKDGNTLRTRGWVIRCWIEQGRINDSLNAIDALDAEGTKGPMLDYLYGMAFAAKARGYIDQGTGGSAIQMSLEDAVQYLERATKADPELARDAFLPLADAAWYAQRLEVGRAAAEKAVARQPESVDAHATLGKIALAQFGKVREDPSATGEADAHWETARKAFARAAELLGSPESPAQLEQLARVRLDLAHVYVWKEKLDLAELEYGEAMAAKPALVDFAQARKFLGPDRFLAALEWAQKMAASRPLLEAPDLATIDWWLGWSRYEQKQYEKADEAFAAAVARWPSFVNTWFYMALCRYHRQDYEGAIAALRRQWDEDPSSLVSMIGTAQELHLRILDFLVDWLAGKERFAEAAELSEVQTAAAPEESRFWNNVGLFWRDAGQTLEATGRPGIREEVLADYEKSWKAYEKALAIEPDNPAFLNDAAVILHYYLQRDDERAKEMYRKAAERAEAELARKDLAPDLRELFTTALRDSKDNLEKLLRGQRRE